jgi:glucokinase
MTNSVIKTKVVGIDIGVNETSIAIVDLRGTILAQDTLKTSDFPLVNDFVEALSERIVMMAEANGGYEVVRSVGVSAPSANFLTGCIENAGNIPWKGIVPLAAMLRDRVGLAVALGNDAHVTAMGEFVYGSAHGMENFIVVSLGHGGLGSCFFSGGHPHLGNGGYAGEMGHACVVDGGRQCSCGRKGCLEEYASDRGIIATAKEVMAESDEPSLMRELTELTPVTIGECCDKGDKLAKKVYDITGLYLGIGLANYATVINPEAIILTGELTEAAKWFMEPLLKSFDEHVFGNIRGKVKVQVSVLDNHERDVLGASALAWSVKEYSLFL